MNIDFHYGVVYVVARAGGLSCDAARTVAHACQYVDDATTPGILRFAGGETFDNAFKSQWELFLRHIVTGEPFRWNLLEGAKGVQLAEKGLESWRKRAWVDVPALEQ